MMPAARGVWRGVLVDPSTRVALGAAVAYLAFAAFWPDSFWSSDSALKLLQVDALAHGRVAVPYLARDLDATARLAPMHPAFFEPTADGLRLVWPLGFALVSLPLYLALGTWGLYVLPALSGAMTVYASGRLSERLAPGSGGAAAATVAFASPIFVYGVSFWEHVVAACLTTSAALALAGNRWALAGGLFALAAGAVRADTYTLAAAVVVATALVARAKTPRLLIGFVAISLPLWALNARVTGHALPLNAARNFSTVSFQYMRQAGASGAVSEFLFSAGGGLRVTAVVLTALLVFALLVLPKASRFAPALWTASAALVAAVSVGTLFEHSFGAEPFAVPEMHGVVQACPFVLLAAGFRPSHGAEPALGRLLALTVALYAPAYLLALCLTSGLGPAGGFSEWGPRFFLPFFPLAIVLGISATRQRRALASAAASFAVVALVLASGASAAMGLYRLWRFTAVKDAAARAQARVPGALLADAWWLSTLHPKAILGRRSVTVENYDDFISVAEALRRRQESGAALASFFDARRHPFLPAAAVEGAGIEVESDTTTFGAHAIGFSFRPQRSSLDDVTFGDGFYVDEHDGWRHWRWTGAFGELSIPRPRARAAGPGELQLLGALPLEAVEQHATVTVRIDGVLAERFEPSVGPFLRRIPLPTDASGSTGGTHRIRLDISHTFRIPAGGRAVGLLLRGVRVE